MSSVRLPENEVPSEHHKLIEMKSKGYLLKPPSELFNLIPLLERSTMKVLNTKEICSETLFKITAAVEDLSPLPFIGCDKHRMMFTHHIISFYLTTRMFFITKQCNKNDDIENRKTKEKRKLSKLSYAPDNKINDDVAKENHEQTVI